MKRIFSFFFILILFMTCITVSAEPEGDGMTFETEYQYYAKVLPTELPVTYEATLKLPVNAEYEYNNTIFGSYMVSYTSGLIFGVNTEGQPYLSLSNEDDGVKSAVFENVNLFTGEWVHLALTWDQGANTVTCYVNGTAVGTVAEEFPENIKLHYPLGLATDQRSVNRYHFKGALKNAALYNDLRTPQEIAADYAGTLDQDGLMAAYDLSAGGHPETIPDQSGNGNDMVLKSFWVTEKEPVEDYAYSFAVLGDPQWLTKSHPDKLENMFNWIKEHIDDKKMKHLFTVGDLTHNSTNEQWLRIWSCLDELNDVLPYTVVRGNHDKISDFNLYFDHSTYEESIDGSFKENMLNTYRCFDVGSVPYMSLVLDYSVTDEALEWANEVIAAHPDRNVIVTTHSYLTANGELSPVKNSDQTNSGQDIWDKLISKHQNIVLVLCGHVTSGNQMAVNQMQGNGGNTVTQLMINSQSADHELGGIGVVTMLYFSKDGKNVQIEHFSTDRNAFFMEENQISLELDLVDSGNDPLLWIFIGAGALLIVSGSLFLLLRKKKATAQPAETE